MFLDREYGFFILWHGWGRWAETGQSWDSYSAKMSLWGLGIVLSIVWSLALGSSLVLESKLGIANELISLLDWTTPISTLKLTQMPLDSRKLPGPRFLQHSPIREKHRRGASLSICLPGREEWLSCSATADFTVNLLPLNSAWSYNNC